MRRDGIIEYGGTVPRSLARRPGVPRLARLIDKFVLDIMPAALASVIGGFLVTQYQLGRPVPPVAPPETATPASVEMMALLRDEHALIMDYLKIELAAEKARAAAAQAVDRPAPARTVQDGSTSRPSAIPAKSLQPSSQPSPQQSSQQSSQAPGKPAAATGATAPLVVIQAQQDEPAQAPSSILARTLDIKDQLVAATRHVVGLLGDALSSVGEHIGSVVSSGRSMNATS